MDQYEGLKLRPLFHSEISSSFMLYELFRNHKNIVMDFVDEFIGIKLAGTISINREKSYKGKGSIDIIINTRHEEVETNILIEVKVHDYASATPGQIKTYFEAALEEQKHGDIYFIYLTQFNRNNEPSNLGASLPGTIKEFDDARNLLRKYKDNLRHVSWPEFHKFINNYKDELTLEEKLMIDLQENWIRAEIDNDIKNNNIEVGDRDILDYFDDIAIDVTKELPFGAMLLKNRRTIFSIQLNMCSYEQLEKVLNIIKIFASSSRVDTKSIKDTEDITLNGAKEFLGSLSQDDTKWNLLSFYARLFSYIHATNYLLLHGTGSRGFSIKVTLKEKGTVSLCTIWANGTLEFSLKR